MSATSEVENSISIMAIFPSSLLNIRENGSVWYIRNPLDVPEAGAGQRSGVSLGLDQGTGFAVASALTNSEAAVVLVKCDKIE